MAGFDFEMTWLRVRGPMPSSKGSPRGERLYWEMSEGTLDGPPTRKGDSMRRWMVATFGLFLAL